MTTLKSQNLGPCFIFFSMGRTYDASIQWIMIKQSTDKYIPKLSEKMKNNLACIRGFGYHVDKIFKNVNVITFCAILSFLGENYDLLICFLYSKCPSFSNSEQNGPLWCFLVDYISSLVRQKEKKCWWENRGKILGKRKVGCQEERRSKIIGNENHQRCQSKTCHSVLCN